MITFSALGNLGRLANQLFQIAATLGTAERNGTTAALPEWPYEQYFTEPLPHGPQSQRTYKEPRFEYDEMPPYEDIDLYGYFQSARYFPAGWKPTFREDWLRTLYRPPADRLSIGIHIRRGDYVNHPLYYQLPISWYISALASIQGWREANVVVVSDDVPYAQLHFGAMPNVHFPNGTEIEDLAIYSRCDVQILSNSSFSWWGCYLSDQQAGIHSGQLFRGDFIRKTVRDFYLPKWTLHTSGKIDLRNTTFTIPVYMDSKDRKNNLDLSVCMLQHSFETNIIVGEQGSAGFEYMKQYAAYVRFELPYFHRTKMLNDMALMARTPYIANWDCDVVLPPMQILLTVLALQDGFDMVFPYDGRFSRWERRAWFTKIQKAMDVGVFSGHEPVGARGKSIQGQTSVGGAVFFNRRSFIEGGMENENMISFGPEDCERNDRFKMLGYNVGRVGGCLYHIDHWCGPDSSRHNPYFKANHEEIERVRDKSPRRLRAYVDTWPWVPKRKTLVEVCERLADAARRAGEEAGLEFKMMVKRDDNWVQV